MSAHDSNLSEIRNVLLVSNNWSDIECSHEEDILKTHVCTLDSRKVPISDMHTFLMEHKGFHLALLENPQLIEHDRFTPLMQALFHLTDVLMAWEKLIDLPPADYAHLSGDVNRVYRLLMIEWLTYMKYLKQNYPTCSHLSTARTLSIEMHR